MRILLCGVLVDVIFASEFSAVVRCVVPEYTDVLVHRIAMRTDHHVARDNEITVRIVRSNFS